MLVIFSHKSQHAMKGQVLPILILGGKNTLASNCLQHKEALGLVSPGST